MGTVMSIVDNATNGERRSPPSECILSPHTTSYSGAMTVGKAVAMGGGLVCLGVLLSPRRGFFDRAAYDWPSLVTKHINETYFYYFGSLVIATISGWCCYQSNYMIEYLANYSDLEVFCVTNIAVYMAGYLVKNIPYTEQFGLKHVATIVYASVIGVVLSPICLVGYRLIVDAAWMTAAMNAELTLTALLIPSAWVLRMIKPILIGYVLVDIAYLATFFAPSTSRIAARARVVDLYGGLLVYTGYTIYLSHLTLVLGESLVGAQGFDPISISHLLFVGTINLFLRVTALMSIEDCGRRGSLRQ